jgi:flagellar protein FliS
MTETNPYKTYADEAILNASPLGLIIALYEGAIESAATARHFLLTGDIPARTKAINKTINIVSELMRSLNDEKGGEVSANLRRLYGYIQAKVVEAHTRKTAAPLQEVEKLLSILLDGWKGADAKFDPTAAISAARHEQSNRPQAPSTTSYEYADSASPYGNYHPEAADGRGYSAYSF